MSDRNTIISKIPDLDRILMSSEVAELLNFKNTQAFLLWRSRNKSSGPTAFRLGNRGGLRWRLSTVMSWIESQEAVERKRL